MQVNILIFGKLIDLIGGRTITLHNITDTEALKERLLHDYPGIAGLPYLIAVDKEVIQSNAILIDNCTVALLPPYAGG